MICYVHALLYKEVVDTFSSAIFTVPFHTVKKLAIDLIILICLDCAFKSKL